MTDVLRMEFDAIACISCQLLFMPRQDRCPECQSPVDNVLIEMTTEEANNALRLALQGNISHLIAEHNDPVEGAVAWAGFIARHGNPA